MASVIFDKLWDEAFKREGELVTDAATLASVYKIASAVEAVRLARVLQESGRSFFECCDALYRTRQQQALELLRRKHKLSPRDVKLLKELMDKATKGW